LSPLIVVDRRLEETAVKEKAHYTEAFRQQALEKVYTRGNRTVDAVAEELNVNPWTLRNWMKSHRRSTPPNASDKSAKRPGDWTRAERLQVLMESHGLDDEALNAFCRERGLFRHHLEQWQADFEAATAPGDPAQLRELKAKTTALERDLKRKDQALAEAAALLVLQKKYRALWEGKDD
jgi:transposase-like protein